jgi:hypothetical protein
LRFSLLPAVLLLTVATPAVADTVTDSQAWLTASGSTRLSDRWSLGLAAIGRFGNRAGGLYETEFGGALTYDLGHGLSLSGGYVRVPDYAHGNTTSIEDRPSETIGFSIAKLGTASLTGRVKLEERFRNDGGDMGLRLAPMVKLTVPFRPGSATALVVSHESFMQLNDTDWGQAKGYSRMRNLVGIKTALAPHLTIEGDYLNQYDFGLRGANDKMANVAILGVAVAF